MTAAPVAVTAAPAADVQEPAHGSAWAAEVLDRVARRYRSCSRFTRHYVASKVRRDPVHRLVLAMGAAAPFGAVSDVGCGRGQVGLALLEAGVATSVVGLDWAGRSLEDARRAGAGLPFSALAQNLAEDAAIPACDTLLLIDVVYLLRREQALRLLATAAAAARSRVIVRTLDRDRGLRSRLHLLAERLGRPVWPHSGAVVDPAPVPLLMAALEQAGFAVEAQPCWQGTPFANVLLTGRRPSAAR